MNIFKRIISLPNEALRAVAQHAVINQLKSWAEAPEGSAKRVAYDLAKGRKTLVGLFLGVSSAVALTMDATTAAEWLGAASAVLMGAGLADKALSADGRPAALQDSAAYKLLAEHAGWIATGLTSWGAYTMGSNCTAYQLGALTFTCAAQGKIVLALAATAAYLKIIDVGMLTSVPGMGRFRLPKY